MDYPALKVRLTGVAPLLLHNGRLADPSCPETKAVREFSTKKNKTDADYEELARREWLGSLYTDESGHVCIPGNVIEAAIVSGARKQKRGKQAQAGVFVDGTFKLQNGGANLSDLKALWEGGKHAHRAMVVVNQARTTRCRPIFDPWAVEVIIKYDPDVVNEADIMQALNAGVAIGDYRPKYGRFNAKKIK